MKRRILSILLIVQMTVFTTFTFDVVKLYAIATTGGKSESDRFLVTTRSSTAVQKIYKHFDKAETLSEVDNQRLLTEHIACINGNYEKVKALLEENDVISIEKDREVKGLSTLEPTISTEKTQWNMKVVNANKIKSKKNKIREKVKVAILDSGVDLFNDIEVKKSINLIPGEEEVSPLFVDGSGHGTSICGLLAAEDNDVGITGINPNVEVYSARILDDENKAPVSRVIAGIDWAIDNKVDIISISFGMDKNSEALKAAIQKADLQGILIIAAAGNNGAVEYPAAYPEVMAVGSVNCEAQVSSYSAIGREVDIVAPGEMVCSTGAFDGILVSSGTSLAVPHVVGAASLIWEKDKTVTKEFVRYLLSASANKKLNAEKESFGYGLLDIEYALDNYEIFYDRYSKLITKNTYQNVIPPNYRNIKKIDKDSLVKGSWLGDDHEICVIYAGNTWGGEVTPDVIAAMKKGARYPDFEKSGYKGMGAYPYFHGYFKYDTLKSYNNYIASYIYATKLAQKIRHGNANTLAQAGIPKGMNDATAAQMRNLIVNIPWSSYGCTNNKLKGAFAWGVAMHTATDVYAHSVYGNYNGWQRFFHNVQNGNDYADNSSIVDLRFRVAKRVAENAIDCYVENIAGTAEDFCYFTDGLSYNASQFMLYNFSEYLNITGGASLSSEFNAFSRYYTIK